MVNYFDKKNVKNIIDDEDINIYVCGPTVYNDVHIGNLRPIIFFSWLRNIFKYQNKNVRLLQNITDVDDKILAYSKANGLKWQDVATKYTNAYHEVLREYNINNIEFYQATNYIQTYVNLVDELIIKDLAYINDSGAYLKVNEIKDYGEVSNQDISALAQSGRIENKEDKENSKDFAILKIDEEFGWKTKYGKVRPGWHLECFGIINSVLEQNLTIHGGGIDLIFPHHENENALNLALNNQSLAKHWLHVGLLTLNGEKMSKSIGNLILAKDFVKDYGSNVLKYLYLQNTYTKPINITDDLIKSCQKFDQNIFEVVKILEIYKDSTNYEKTSYLTEFEELLTNISLPNLYSILQKMIKDFNKNLIEVKMYSSVLTDLKVMFEILDLTYQTRITNLDIANIKYLNETSNFEEINEFLEVNPDYKKTRKGWTKK